MRCTLDEWIPDRTGLRAAALALRLARRSDLRATAHAAGGWWLPIGLGFWTDARRSSHQGWSSGGWTNRSEQQSSQMRLAQETRVWEWRAGNLQRATEARTGADYSYD